MSVTIKTTVAVCPYCEFKDAVLSKENDHIFICRCGASFVKWWADEQEIEYSVGDYEIDEDHPVVQHPARLAQVHTADEKSQQVRDAEVLLMKS